MPEEVVYNMTKAYWENIADVHATAAWMKSTLTKENALKQMNVPLHAGAYKYYVEAGWKVPEGLKPPEAK
ncbi:MAG: TAXI family TRAP transporter solute-binding subunit [Burkholderiaceae bacterium]